MTLPSRRAPLTLLILPGLLALFALYLLIPWSTVYAQQASQEDTCPGADSAPTPTVVEVGAVPIVVESTTDEYFVLYVRHDLDADTTFEVPVGVTLGQDGATTLTESLEALLKERYRVEKYLVSDPADVDGDCTDDITELADPVGMNPVNPVPAMSFDDGAAAIPNRETYVSLAYKGEIGAIDRHLAGWEAVKFHMVDMNTDRPSVYFMNTKTYQRHIQTGVGESIVLEGVKGGNSPATGAPTIGGTPQVDETLTADTSNIADQDGLTNVSYSYQWMAGGSDIDGATGSSYTLKDVQKGQTIQVRVSFRDDADNDETLTSDATATVVGPPLTVRLVFPVAGHHGASNVFTFDIRFSEEIPLSYKTLKLHAFSVTGGSILKARRMDKPSNIKWRIMVRPDSNEDVTIVLPATTDCEAQGAICTEDGRKLSNSLVFTVSGPVRGES